MKCERCIGAFPDGTTLDPAVRQRVADLVREQRALVAIQMLVDESGWSLTDAKGLVLHLVRTPGTCQRCRGSIDDAERVVCPRCRSLNLRW